MQGDKIVHAARDLLNKPLKTKRSSRAAGAAAIRPRALLEPLQYVRTTVTPRLPRATETGKEVLSEFLTAGDVRKSNGVLVAVRDSGPGIDAKHLERVFEAFYTTKSGGVGMGLSICRSIINAHGGRLWAETNEPRSSVFQFTLPSVEKELMNSASR
jgi:signal transduction histidine kinase